MISNIKKKISLLLFKNQNYIFYNLFNKLYNSFKCNINQSDETIKNFEKNGFSKSMTIKSIEIDKIVSHLNKTQKIYNENRTEYILDSELRLLIKNLFINNFKNEIKKFEEFFSNRIIVSHIKIFTNHSYEKNNNDKKQYFSENFHTDNYLFTYFKLFINLENVSLEKGPLYFVPKSVTSKFIKASNYNNRFSYNEDMGTNLVMKNIGKKGESLFVNTTQCIHRAGIPSQRNSRTMLLFHLNVIPEKQNSDYFEYENSKEDIFVNDFWSRYYAKPEINLKNFVFFKNFFLKKI